jgi:predicted  nucleic acid-binding Zn-ribbon protein
MKLKSLEKKIRRLEARLRAGPRKLAKLKRKLEAMSAAKARKAQKKAAARAVARQTVQSLTATPKKTVKPGSAKKPVAVGKVKRKLNLSPERRAQLSAAMKARWAAKRASPEANPPSTSHVQGSATGGVDRAV